MTTEEQQAITIETLIKHHRSARDSANAHQANSLRKDIQLIEAKRIIGAMVEGWEKGSDAWWSSLQAAKDYLAK